MPFELTNRCDTPIARFLFAHGAGAPADSDFMNSLSELLAARHIEVVRFEFAYMAQRRVDGVKRPPAREPVLTAQWQEVISRFRVQTPELPLFIGGKSMGGRMASLVADEAVVSGLICLGYPFHPQRKPDVLRVAHLAQLATPTLIVQGTRDALGNREEVSHYHLSPAIKLHWLEDGDHDLAPRVKSGFTHQQHLVSAADAIEIFIREKLRNS